MIVQEQPAPGFASLGALPSSAPPTPHRRLHLGASGRFSDITLVPSPSQSPPCPATREHLTCLTQKGLEGRAGCGGIRRRDACPKETPRDLGLGGAGHRGHWQRADGRRAHPTAPLTHSPAHPHSTNDRRGHPTAPPTHSPAPATPHWPHLAQEGAWAHGTEGSRRRTGSHHAPFLTSCVTLGKCLSFSVLSFVSYKMGVTRVRP